MISLAAQTHCNSFYLLTILIYSFATTITDLEQRINNELSKLSAWFRANKLSLNAIKTNFMILGSKLIPLPLKLILDGNLLERTATTKFLGVYLDEKLNWNCHLNHVRNKIY